MNRLVENSGRRRATSPRYGRGLRNVAQAALAAYLAKAVKRRARTQAARALKAYVLAVERARSGAMYAVAAAVLAGFFASGACVLVTGVVWTIASGAEWPQVTMSLAGALLVALTGGLFGYAMRERLWLEKSGASGLVQALVADRAGGSVGGP